MEWRTRLKLSFLFVFLQVCGCELMMVRSSNAGKEEDRVRELDFRANKRGSRRVGEKGQHLI